MVRIPVHSWQAGIGARNLFRLGMLLSIRSGINSNKFRAPEKSPVVNIDCLAEMRASLYEKSDFLD